MHRSPSFPTVWREGGTAIAAGQPLLRGDGEKGLKTYRRRQNNHIVCLATFQVRGIGTSAVHSSRLACGLLKG